MATQHDRIFKQLLRVYLADFLRLVAPEVLEQLDLYSPEFLDKELFAGGPDGRRREPDLLVRVRSHDGSPLLIHVEIEARASQGMRGRLWRYRNQIQVRYEAPVLPIVVYLKRGRPGVCLETWDSALGPAFPELHYISFGLAGCRAEEYLARSEPLAWAFAALMDPGPWSHAELKMACLRRIARLRGRGDAYLLADCVEIYLELDTREVAEFEELHSRRQNKEMRAMAMTWSEKIRASAQKDLLLVQLTERFGPLPDGARRQVEEVNSFQRLTRLAKRLLTAGSLEELGLA